MQELLGLALDGLHNLGMTVAGGIDGDARNKIDIAVAIDIEYLAATTVVHDEIGDTSIGMGNHSLITVQHSLGLGTGNQQQVGSLEVEN